MTQLLFYDLFDKVQNVEDPLKVDVLFDEVKTKYGLSHIIYTDLNIPSSSEGAEQVLSTYSDEWIQHYFSHDYLSIDPVVKAGLTETLPADWGEMPRESKEVKQIFSESKEFGIGGQGLTFPIHGPHEEHAMFCINADMNDREWAARKPDLMRDLYIIAHFFRNSVVAKSIKGDTALTNDLTTRELESLKWAASGKSVWETSVILSVSERTVRFHLDQARRKLRCNTKVQAVAKAVATGLINIS